MNDQPQSAPRKAGLSICMPVYNKGKLLPRTLASIQRQNIADLEIVAVDNGSTDDSRKILESWQDRLDIKIYALPKTISLYENWLLALSLGTREFLKLQLADDMIPDGAINTLLHHLRSHEELGFVLGNTWPMADDGSLIESGDTHAYWSEVNGIRAQMGRARTLKEKADCLARLRIGWSLFGDANSTIFRADLLDHLRHGINHQTAPFQTWPEYEINLRLFAVAQGGHLNISGSYFSYDEDGHLTKVESKPFRRRTHDMPAANLVFLLMLDPDLRPLVRQAGLRYQLKLACWFAAKHTLMHFGKR